MSLIQSSNPSEVSSQKYGAAIINAPPLSQTNVIINNADSNPGIPYYIVKPKLFGNKPIDLTCPYCKAKITTETETSCSCKAVCFCLITDIVFYPIVQCCRKKKICCCDTVHTCPKCNLRLGSYDAC